MSLVLRADAPADEATAVLPVAELAAPALPRVDLLPPEITQRRRLRRVQGGLAVGALASVSLAGLLHLAAAGAVTDAQAELDAAAAVGTGLQAEQTRYQGAVQTRQQAEQAQAVLTEAMGGEVRFSALLDTLGRSTPEGVWLRDVALTQTPASAGPADPAAPAATGTGTVAVTAVGFSHESVAAWLESLAGTPGFADPSFSTASETLLGDRKVVEFSSTATLTPDVLSGRYAPKGG